MRRLSVIALPLTPSAGMGVESKAGRSESEAGQGYTVRRPVKKRGKWAICFNSFISYFVLFCGATD